MTVLLVWIMTSLPYRLAFGIDPEGGWFILERVVDVYFVIDITINFRTSYVDPLSGLEVLEPRACAKYYFRTWFIIDLISSIPFDLIASADLDAATGGGQEAKAAKAAKLGKLAKGLRILRLTKLVKLSRIGKLMEQFEVSYPNFNVGVIKIIKLFVTLIFACHFNSCIWIYIADVESRENWMSLLPYLDIYDDNYMPEYLAGFYWSVQTMTTVGYGDVLPNSQSEMLYVCASMIVGGAYFGYMIALMSALVSKEDHAQSTYRGKINAVRMYVIKRRLPEDLQLRVCRYYKHVLSHEKMFDEAHILGGLSKYLQNEVAPFLANDMAFKIPFLRLLVEKGALFITKFLPLLKPVGCGAGDFVVQANEVGQDMYILKKGRLEVLDENHKVIDTLWSGAYFGEEILLDLMVGVYPNSIGAAVQSQLYTVSSKEFQKEFSDHQALLMQMRTIMRRERKKKADAAAVASSKRKKGGNSVRRKGSMLRRQPTWDANGHVKQVASAKKAAKRLRRLLTRGGTPLPKMRRTFSGSDVTETRGSRSDSF